VKGFYISVANGLLTADHRERMGSAVWEFMWCLDKITRVDVKGIGFVLGGKPVNLSDLSTQLGTVEMTTSRNLDRLEESGYILKLRTPYGIVIKVNKAKKRFNKDVDSKGLNKNVESPNENVDSPNINVESNKTMSVDKVVDSTTKTAGDARELNKIINLFQPVNPSFQKFFPNVSQRSALARLIKLHGEEQVVKVISILPKTNTIQYLPTITTPIQLEDKWASLEAGLSKKKSELTEKSNKNKIHGLHN
jgi:hypothetical protein